MVNRFLPRASSLLLPGYCLLCQQATKTARDLCPACAESLPWLKRHCQRCALPLADTETASLCGKCLQQPPQFHRCLAAWEYQFPLDHVIGRFKYQGHQPSGRVLAECWLDRCGTKAVNSAPDLLLPVPLHWRRRWQRGFNQSQILAEYWSKALNIPISNALKRHRHTPAQQQLNAAQRQRNLKHAFSLKNGIALCGKHLVLVDDVLTTGSTANTLTKLLLEQGAKCVDIWCLARTP
ncbi:ComF family protein [Spongiibacter sp. KMU-158]|uniref:ComF family protein n=1 Tax=Spongiibacter pelagi TaxID=2760804 RepID=A0A927C1Y1_9GAMM|nr:double zinc ribbon domain-containing protein [Spongiibacter pelagi]MBD2857995.1 ComF family protein [Spongiibacter pelagi]